MHAAATASDHSHHEACRPSARFGWEIHCVTGVHSLVQSRECRGPQSAEPQKEGPIQNECTGLQRALDTGDDCTDICQVNGMAKIGKGRENGLPRHMQLLRCIGLMCYAATISPAKPVSAVLASRGRREPGGVESVDGDGGCVVKKVAYVADRSQRMKVARPGSSHFSCDGVVPQRSTSGTPHARMRRLPQEQPASGTPTAGVASSWAFILPPKKEAMVLAGRDACRGGGQCAHV